MRELINKLEELEKEEKMIRLEQQNIMEKIIELKNQKGDFFVEEQKYCENKNRLKEIVKKKEILSDAIDILEGID